MARSLQPSLYGRFASSRNRNRRLPPQRPPVSLRQAANPVINKGARQHVFAAARINSPCPSTFANCGLSRLQLSSLKSAATSLLFPQVDISHDSFPEGESMIHKKLRTALLRMVLFAGVTTAAFSQVAEKEDFDNYHLRIDTAWYYSDPSGNIHGTATTDTGPVDLQKDLGFTSYSTFSGKADWKFTRKNHLYVSVTPFKFSRQKVLNRTITFQGQTFNAGLTTSSSLDTLFVAPGYQYDIIRRRRGHLGIALQMDLFDTTAKINAAAQVTGDGVHHAAVSASGSLIAPIPVARPDFRLYLTDS